MSSNVYFLRKKILTRFTVNLNSQKLPQIKRKFTKENVLMSFVFHVHERTLQSYDDSTVLVRA